jgi:hypothetical protein
MPGSEEFIQSAVQALEAGWVTQRKQVLKKFAFKWNTVALGFENECIFLSDDDREHQNDAIGAMSTFPFANLAFQYRQ